MIRLRPERPVISLIIPLYNEQDTIASLLAEIDTRLNLPLVTLDIVLVNDGSTDATLAMLLAQARIRQDVTVLNLSRNFGKEAAMTAGLDYAKGDAVVLMDADLQDPPELVAQFVAKWREGYDIAYGLRRSRAGETRFKILTAHLFYAWFNRISHTPIPANVGDFRLLDRRVVQALRQLPERTRFMKGLFAWVGFPSVAIEFERPARSHGQTKWSYWRLWQFAVDAIVGFSTAPLQVWSYLGIAVAAGAVGYAAYIFILVFLQGIDVPGYASVIVVILVGTALNLISLGMIGTYLARMFVEAKQRPVYLLEGIYQGGARRDVAGDF